MKLIANINLTQALGKIQMEGSPRQFKASSTLCNKNKNCRLLDHVSRLVKPINSKNRFQLHATRGHMTFKYFFTTRFLEKNNVAGKRNT